MTIPLKQSTDVNAKTAAARLEQIKAQLNLTPSPMSLQAPQDMKEERAAASFDIQKLAHFWAGGERQYRLLQKAFDIIKSDPQLVVQPPRNFLSLSHAESREFTMGQIQRAFQLTQDPVIQSIDQDLGQAIIQALNLYSESFGMRIGVHTALFRNVLLMLGSDEQRDIWLPEVDNYRILGCFAMTELGHSSALRDIETTATYDQVTDEFIIDSPSITSTKWWIGMAGQTATHTTVIAQTYIGGKHVGHNWFIVQLRDKDTGELMPNVIAGDVGHKVGRPGIDNGWIQFRQVRIPRSNMLARWVSLDRDGTYTPAPTPAVMYATLIPERIMLVLNTIMVIAQGVVIATRYGITRRQGNKNQQIMDYQSHYASLLPATAFMYMVRAGLYTLDEQFKTLTAGGDMDPAVYINHMSDMHAISACLKGLSGWYGADILESCRRACGGHAYSAYNYIGQLIADYGVLTTGGGDNVVLLQQTASILLQRLSRKLKHDDYPKLLFKSSTHYMLRAKEYLAQSTWNVQDVSACCNNLSLIEEALNAILVKRLKSILDTQEKGVDRNDLLKDSVRVAEMHAATFLFSNALEKFVNQRQSSDLTKDVVAILQRMTLLWGLHTLHTYSDQGYKSGFLIGQQVKDIEALYLETCKGLRNQAIGLTDGFGFPDFVLKAPIGKYDGNIYEAYFDTVLMQPGSIGKPEYHDRYIKPLTERK